MSLEEARAAGAIHSNSNYDAYTSPSNSPIPQHQDSLSSLSDLSSVSSSVSNHSNHYTSPTKNSKHFKIKSSPNRFQNKNQFSPSKGQKSPQSSQTTGILGYKHFQDLSYLKRIGVRKEPRVQFKNHVQNLSDHILNKVVTEELKTHKPHTVGIDEFQAPSLQLNMSERDLLGISVRSHNIGSVHTILDATQKTVEPENPHHGLRVQAHPGHVGLGYKHGYSGTPGHNSPGRGNIRGYGAKVSGTGGGLAHKNAQFLPKLSLSTAQPVSPSGMLIPEESREEIFRETKEELKKLSFSLPTATKALIRHQHPHPLSGIQMPKSRRE